MRQDDSRRRLRAAAAAARATVLAAAAVAMLAACSTPPWEEPEPSASAPPATSATAAAVQNDLGSGSAQRTLSAGAVSLVVDYWSTLAMDRWTAEAAKPLSLSLTASVEPADGQKAYLSRLTATPVVVDASGAALPGFEPIRDEATVTPGYLVLDPYAYSQTFDLPALDPAAAAVTLELRYELLVQSAPDSTDYAKATAVDTLVIAIAPGD